MKKGKLLAVSSLLCGSLLFSSCIGSFGLWNKLKDWNSGVSNKFVNEIVFLAFHIVPVYEVAYLADIIVLNSIVGIICSCYLVHENKTYSAFSSAFSTGPRAAPFIPCTMKAKKYHFGDTL